MSYSILFERISELKVIPVISIRSPEDAVPLTDALIAGGLPLAEITFRTAAAAEAMKRIAKERPDMLLGAGTVLKTEQLQTAMDSGAKFAVAPGFNLRVVQAALDAEFPFLPGVCTPSEIEGAMEFGFRELKFFPAGAMGGLNLLRAVSAPYAHTGVRFVPTGGVNISNLPDYLAVPGVLACGGSWIASAEDIAEKRWELITARCREIRSLNKCD